MASGHGATSPSSYMRRGRHGAGSRQGGGLAAMVLEEMCDCLNLSGDALLLAEFWILPLAFFANLAPSRLVLEETACSNSNRAAMVGFW